MKSLNFTRGTLSLHLIPAECLSQKKLVHDDNLMNKWQEEGKVKFIHHT